MLCYLSLAVNSEVENMTRNTEVDIKTTAVNTIRDFTTIQPLQIEKAFSSLQETFALDLRFHFNISQGSEGAFVLCLLNL